MIENERMMNPPETKNPERRDIILNNILAAICDATEIQKQQWIPWLKTEVGMTDDEISHLKEVNCFPEPQF